MLHEQKFAIPAMESRSAAIESSLGTAFASHQNTHIASARGAKRIEVPQARPQPNRKRELEAHQQIKGRNEAPGKQVSQDLNISVASAGELLRGDVCLTSGLFEPSNDSAGVQHADRCRPAKRAGRPHTVASNIPAWLPVIGPPRHNQPLRSCTTPTPYG